MAARVPFSLCLCVMGLSAACMTVSPRMTSYDAEAGLVVLDTPSCPDCAPPSPVVGEAAAQIARERCGEAVSLKEEGFKETGQTINTITGSAAPIGLGGVATASSSTTPVKNYTWTFRCASKAAAPAAPEAEPAPAGEAPPGGG